jgi:ubiquinone biosynthesis monooxygenase Coq7
MKPDDVIEEFKARDIVIPEELVPWMRSNHAGETGAVWIYKGAKCIFWSKKIKQMASEHEISEIKHLIIMQHLVGYSKRSKLLFLWKIMGFLLGFLPSLVGYKTFCITINAVETFVRKHYEEQIKFLEKNKCYPNLLYVLQKCFHDEVSHQQDAKHKITNVNLSFIEKIWFSVVGFGSAAAVKIAKII